MVEMQAHCHIVGVRKSKPEKNTISIDKRREAYSGKPDAVEKKLITQTCCVEKRKRKTIITYRSKYSYVSYMAPGFLRELPLKQNTYSSISHGVFRTS